MTGRLPPAHTQDQFRTCKHCGSVLPLSRFVNENNKLSKFCDTCREESDSGGGGFQVNNVNLKTLVQEEKRLHESEKEALRTEKELSSYFSEKQTAQRESEKPENRKSTQDQKLSAAGLWGERQTASPPPNKGKNAQSWFTTKKTADTASGATQQQTLKNKEQTTLFAKKTEAEKVDAQLAEAVKKQYKPKW